MIALTVNEVVFQYPETDDEDWGAQATLWAKAVTDLIATVRNGTPPLATVGAVRLGNGDRVAWRNTDNDGNVSLKIDSNDHLIYDDGDTEIDITAFGDGNVIGPLASNDERLARFDGTSGQLLQNSLAVLSDAGALSGITSLSISGALAAVTNIIASGNISCADIDTDTGTIDALDGTSAAFDSVDAIALKEAGTDVSDLFIAREPNASVGDNRIVRWDGTTGKAVQNSAISIDDSGNITGIEDLTVANTINCDTIEADDATFSAQAANAVREATTREVDDTVAAGGTAESGSSGAEQTQTGTTFDDIPGLSVTITTSGKPVLIGIFPDGGGSSSYIGAEKTTASADTLTAIFRVLRGATTVARFMVGRHQAGITISVGSYSRQAPPGIIAFDPVAAGTYTYTVEFAGGNAAGVQATCARCKLVAYEL